MSDVNHMESPVVGRETAEAEPVSPCQVECACRSFLEVHAALAAVGNRPQTSVEGASLDPDEDVLAAIRKRRALALHTILSLRATSTTALLAKAQVLAVLVDWSGGEDAMTGPFAIQIVKEAIPFFRSLAAEPLHTTLKGPFPKHGRPPWIDRLQRLTWFASDQKGMR